MSSVWDNFQSAYPISSDLDEVIARSLTDYFETSARHLPQTQEILKATASGLQFYRKNLLNYPSAKILCDTLRRVKNIVDQQSSFKNVEISKSEPIPIVLGQDAIVNL